MNVVDSSGWIEYFTERQNAGFFVPPIQNTARLLVPTICIYEVFKRLLAERDEDSALLAVGFMAHGQEVELTRKIAIEAAQISRERRLAMGQTASSSPQPACITPPSGHRTSASKTSMG